MCLHICRHAESSLPDDKFQLNTTLGSLVTSARTLPFAAASLTIDYDAFRIAPTGCSSSPNELLTLKGKTISCINNLSAFNTTSTLNTAALSYPIAFPADSFQYRMLPQFLGSKTIVLFCKTMSYFASSSAEVLRDVSFRCFEPCSECYCISAARHSAHDTTFQSEQIFNDNQCWLLLQFVNAHLAHSLISFFCNTKMMCFCLDAIAPLFCLSSSILSLTICCVPEQLAGMKI